MKYLMKIFSLKKKLDKTLWMEFTEEEKNRMDNYDTKIIYREGYTDYIYLDRSCIFRYYPEDFTDEFKEADNNITTSLEAALEKANTIVGGITSILEI